MVRKLEGKPKVLAEESSVNVKSWDELEQKIALPELTHTQYSNGYEIRAAEDEIYIDFHELPGTIKDGQLYVKMTRIYLTIKTARNLNNAITGTLKNIK